MDLVWYQEDLVIINVEVESKISINETIYYFIAWQLNCKKILCVFEFKVNQNLPEQINRHGNDPDESSIVCVNLFGM